MHLKNRKILNSLAILLVAGVPVTASGEKVVPLRFGDMEHWAERHIKESAVIGGNEKILYEIGPDAVIEGNIPYKNQGDRLGATPTSWPRWPAWSRPTTP